MMSGEFMTRIRGGAVLALAATAFGCGMSSRPSAAAPQSGSAPQFATRAPDYWPTDAWKVSSPEEQGMSSTSLAKAVDLAARESFPIHSLLIVRRGYVVLDATFYPFAPESRHDVASITKSVTSLLVGAAVERGILPSP